MAAADQPGIRDGVVGRETRAGCHQRRAVVGAAGDAVDTRRLNGLARVIAGRIVVRRRASIDLPAPEDQAEARLWSERLHRVQRHPRCWGCLGKKSPHASEQDKARAQQARADYQELIDLLDPQRPKSTAESDVNLAMIRPYGRAPKGKRVIGAVPQNDGQNVGMLGALGPQGIRALMTAQGATDGDVFLAPVEHVLAPTLQPGDIVVMDNLRAHKVAGVQSALEGCGARLLYWLP